MSGVNDTASPEISRWLATQRELVLLMAHDLRNPLAAVLANLNFVELVARQDEQELLEAVADIKVSTETLLRLIENYVAIAKLESGIRVVSDEMERVPAADSVRAAFERALPAIRAAGVEAALDVLANDACVRGDSALLELLVENLLGNVGQHLRRGQHAKLTLSATETAVILALDDEGVAFGPPGRDFTRDGQLEMKKRSDSRYSRGLALYLVGLIAGTLGGELDTSSPDGKGHLRVTLPGV